MLTNSNTARRYTQLARYNQLSTWTRRGVFQLRSGRLDSVFLNWILF